MKKDDNYEQEIIDVESEFEMIEIDTDDDKSLELLKNPMEGHTSYSLGIIKQMELTERVAEKFASSTLVPVEYRNRPENCYIATDIAMRMGISPVVVMQNLHVINGKPSFSGTAMGALIRSAPHLKNVKVNFVGEKKTADWGCYISAINRNTGEELIGATVTLGIAKAEGWFDKAGSKWKTMPEVMLVYRAYSWFGRTYIPEITMGFHTTEELEDIQRDTSSPKNPYKKGD